jgi:hypothetical protein
MACTLDKIREGVEASVLFPEPGDHVPIVGIPRIWADLRR